MFERLGVTKDHTRQRLACYLGEFEQGCRVDFTTPMLGSRQQTDDEKEASRARVGDALWEECQLDTVQEFLRSNEVKQRLKHGTYSKYPPYHTKVPGGKSLEDGVRRYFDAHPVRMTNGDALRYADGAVSALVQGRSLLPSPLEDAAKSFHRSGYGFPWMSSDPRLLYSVYCESSKLIDDGLDLNDASDFPAVLGTRGQAKGPYQFAKTRVVYQCCRVIGNLEKMLFIPIFETLRKNSMFYAWVSRYATNVAVTRMLGHSQPVLSVDFAEFDASVPFEVLDRVFGIIGSWFKESSGPLVSFCHEAFKRCGIFTPGKYYHGTTRLGGIPSGSVFTNLVGSLVNLWVMHYAAADNGVRVLHSLVQGDDGLYVFSGSSPAEISLTLRRDLGMVMAPEKCHYSRDEAHFLQNVHCTSFAKNGLYVGVRPLMRVVNGMMSYERLRDGWKGLYDAFRWLQQMESASDHPRFEVMCKWLLQYDRFFSEALTAIANKEEKILQGAESALSGGRSGTYTKVSVRSLGTSNVFRVLCSNLGIKVPCP